MKIILQEYRKRANNDRMSATMWLLAYVAALLVPTLLVWSRGGADVAVSLIGVLFIGNSVRNRDWRWLRDPVVRIGLLAWAWLMIVSPFAVSASESFEVAVPWIRFLLLYAALRYWVLERQEMLEFLGHMMVALLAFVAFDAFWQYTHGISLEGHIPRDDGRLTGPFKNYKVGIYVAKMFLPVVAICLHFGLMRQQKGWVIGSVVILFTGVIMIMLSGERTAFISTMLGIALIAGLFVVCERRTRKISLMVVFMLILTTLLMWKTQLWVQDRAFILYESLVNFKTTAYGQLFWAAEQLGKEHPLLGTGLKGFRVLCLDYLNRGDINHCNLHPHNPYLEWFAETGVMGVVLFTAMVLAWFDMAARSFKKHTSAEQRVFPAVALGTLVLHFCPLLGTQSIFSNWPAILVWYSLGVVFAGVELNDRWNA